VPFVPSTARREAILGGMTPGIQELMRQNERAWDAHRDAVAAGDLERALSGTDAATSLVNLPVRTGAPDRAGLRRYLAEDLLPHLPADLVRRRLSRTVDRFRLVEEELVAFTHDRELPWLLPGAAPTHRHAEVVAITIATFRQGRIGAQRTLWDHAGLLARLGLSADAVRTGPAAAPAVAEKASWW
jgi:carboxymethylenebutenolidase